MRSPNERRVHMSGSLTRLRPAAAGCTPCSTEPRAPIRQRQLLQQQPLPPLLKSDLTGSLDCTRERQPHHWLQLPPFSRVMGVVSFACINAHRGAGTLKDKMDPLAASLLLPPTLHRFHADFPSCSPRAKLSEVAVGPATGYSINHTGVHK